MNGFEIALLVAGIALFLFIAACVTIASVLLHKSLRRVSESEKKTGEARFYDSLTAASFGDRVEEMKKGARWTEETPYKNLYMNSFDGLKLHARLYENPACNGITVVMCHGFRSSPTHDFSLIAPVYYSMGCDLLLIDQRTHGESEGRFISLGTNERYDVKDWCRLLYDRYGDGRRIVISGISMGCTTALLAAALPDMPGSLAGVIADCGFDNIRDEIKHVVGKMMRLPVFPLVPIAELICRARAGFGFKDFSVSEEIPKVKVPVLFIHGQADDFVPPSNTEKIYGKCVTHKEYISVPGAGHGQGYLMDTGRCLERLRAFMASVR